MKIRRCLFLACLCGLLPVAVQAAAPPVDRVIVMWRGDASTAVTPEGLRQLTSRTGQRVLRGQNISGRMSVLHLAQPREGNGLAATLRALRMDPEVELAEPDRRVRVQAFAPSDPLFAASQWYLQGNEPSAIRADAAWDISRGGSPDSAVVIAVIDTGVRLDHPDLAGKLLPGYDFVSTAAIAADGDGWDADPSDPGDFLTAADLLTNAFKDGDCGPPSSSTWHGTRVSGLLAANTDNGQGISGTGFHVKVLPVRALGKCGGFESDVIAAMYWSAGLVPPPPLLQSTSLPVNANPAQILNMSLGSEGACTATYTAAVRDVTARGVLVVASAGNEGAVVGSPASCPGVLAVAGLRHVGTKVGYSNLGPEVGIAAPAGNCVNTGINDPCLFALTTTTNAGAQGPTVNTYSDALLQPTYGTSFATPLVAGTAGLMKAVNPSLTPALLITRIRESARAFPVSSADTTPQPPACALPASSPLQNSECICNTQVCGAGMLDAAAAVTAALRPAALARVDGVPAAGRVLNLDGRQSAAATGRSIARYEWSVDGLEGGASMPTISQSDAPLASVGSPLRGSVRLRLTVTDNLGSVDSVVVSIRASGDTSSTAPPPAPPDSGGGPLSPLFLSLAALLLGLRYRIHSTARRV